MKGITFKIVKLFPIKEKHEMRNLTLLDMLMLAKVRKIKVCFLFTLKTNILIEG